MNKQERDEYMRIRILIMIARIEAKTGKMAHEIPELKDGLKAWQDGEIKSSYFNLTVVNYFDKLDYLHP